MFSGTLTLRLRRGGRAKRPIRSLLWIIIFSLFNPVLNATSGEDPSSAVEYQLKAALLYQFTKYVEWPPQRFSPDDRPIIIGILGKNPFGDELARLLEGRKANGRGLIAKQIYSMNAISSVDVLFVAAGEELHAVGNTMDLIQAPGVLTVGETEQFTALGGVITFVTVDEKIHFEVSPEALKRSGLKMSPQLLKLSSHGKKKI